MAHSDAESQKDDRSTAALRKAMIYTEKNEENGGQKIGEKKEKKYEAMRQWVALLSRHVNFASRSVEMGNQGVEKVRMRSRSAARLPFCLHVRAKPCAPTQFSFYSFRPLSLHELMGEQQLFVHRCQNAGDSRGHHCA